MLLLSILLKIFNWSISMKFDLYGVMKTEVKKNEKDIDTID